MVLKSKTDYNRKNIEISKINYRKIIDCFFFRGNIHCLAGPQINIFSTWMNLFGRFWRGAQIKSNGSNFKCSKCSGLNRSFDLDTKDDILSAMPLLSIHWIQFNSKNLILRNLIVELISFFRLKKCACFPQLIIISNHFHRRFK